MLAITSNDGRINWARQTLRWLSCLGVFGIASCGLYGSGQITFDDDLYSDALEYVDENGDACIPDAETFVAGNGDQGGDTAQGVPTTNPDEDRRGGDDKAHGDFTATISLDPDSGSDGSGSPDESGSGAGSGSGSADDSSSGSGSMDGSGADDSSGSGTGSSEGSGTAGDSGSLGMGCDAYGCCSVSDDADMDMDRDRDTERCRCRIRIWNGEQWVLPECCEEEEPADEAGDDMPPPPVEEGDEGEGGEDEESV